MASGPQTPRDRFELEFTSSVLLNAGAGLLASLIIYVCTAEFFQLAAKVDVIIVMACLVAFAVAAAYIWAFRAKF